MSMNCTIPTFVQIAAKGNAKTYINANRITDFTHDDNPGYEIKGHYIDSEGKSVKFGTGANDIKEALGIDVWA